MINITRYPKNPTFLPEPKHPWESYAAFNGSVIKIGDKYKLLYRAMSQKQLISGADLQLSVIGKADSIDGTNFDNRELFITPSEDWDKFGCEDPRVTKVDDEYFIFYTALSNYPFTAQGIKVGLAISDDLTTVREKHLVTPFNAKGMSFFSEKINGKYAAILTSDSDYPPSTIAIAYFDKKEDVWSSDYWEEWHKNLDKHSLSLIWSGMERVDVGSSPLKTPYGWLLLYCSVKDHAFPDRQFQIKAVLLDLNDPQKVIGAVKQPLLIPETDYELNGNIPNTIFPTSVTLEDDIFSFYYSAADTSICIATTSTKELYSHIQITNATPVKFEKFEENPILRPIPEHDWEAFAVYNPTAIKLDGKIHLIYRAQSKDNTSTFGYATTTDGVHIDERLPDPIYVPREDFELKKYPNGNSGCEDARVTLFEDKLYFCYTAYTGVDVTRVALTSITVENFLKRNWVWEKPVLITAPGIYDKDACIFPETFNGKYLFLHRITPGISVDYTDTLVFGDSNWLKTQSYIVPRPHTWDDEKIGIGPTPIKTPYGWLLIYHGISTKDHFYRAGVMLMDLKEPQIIIARTEYPVLEPTEDYEKANGRGIVFPCGVVEVNEYLYTYYGGGDGNICVAKINYQNLLDYLKNQSNKKYLLAPPLRTK